VTAEERGFAQGVAWAVSVMSRFHIGPGDLLQESGISYAEFKAAQVVASDLKALRAVMKTEGMRVGPDRGGER